MQPTSLLMRSPFVPIRLWVFLALVVNGMLLVSLLGFGAYSAAEQTEFRVLEIQRDVKNMSRSIAASAANDLLAENYDNLESLLLRHIVIGFIQEMSLADSSGRILIRVRRDADGEPRVVYVPTPELIGQTDSEQSAPDAYAFIQPIERGQRLGWVRVQASLKEVDSLRRHIWRDSLLISVLTALVAGLLLLLFLRRTSRILEETTQFAVNLRQQLDSRLPVSSGIIELRQLQQALNNAALDLASHFRTIQDTQARKSAILEASMDCLVTIDSQGRIIDFNPAAEATFGYQRHEVLGQLMTNVLVPPNYRAAHTRGMTRFMQTGIGPVLRKRIEISAIRRDGSEFPIELAIVPFKGGGEQYFLGSIRDISKRKLLEAEQERINALLQQTVSELKVRQLALDEHAIVSISDASGAIIFVNDKLLQITGYSQAELLGQNHSILKSGHQDPAFYQRLWETISAGQVWHGELANRRKDGEIYWVTSTIVPMLDSEGRPRQYISIHTDISANKRAEQQLALYQAHLESLVEQYREAERQLSISRERELAVGHQIQRSLLFGDVPATLRSLSLVVHTEPSMGVDGDFYEFTNYKPRYFDLSIADVMGKGITAALIGAALKQRMNQVVATLMVKPHKEGWLPSPEAIMNAVSQRVTAKLIELETFVTLFYLRFDLESNQVTFVNAGHTRAILAGTSGLRFLSGDNLPLGVMESEQYQQETVQLHPADLLFLYSDGVSEARSATGEEFGEERLSRLVQDLTLQQIPPQIIVQAVRKAVQDLEPSNRQRDDRTCIALQLCSADDCADPPQSLSLPWALDALTPLRLEVEAMAARAGLDEDASHALVLAAFEAATNVIRHNPMPLADATLHCRLEIHDGSLSVCLHYLGEPFDASERAPDLSGISEGGFGLYIIRNSVDEVSYDSPVPGICRIRMTKHGKPSTNSPVAS